MDSGEGEKMDRYLIIADDFTGANDTGVQLKRRGLRTSVIFAGRKPPEDEGCVVVDTESRGVGAEEAAEVMRLACGELRFDDYKYVIKKVDPSLRGNIAAESAVLDELYRPELVIFAPALPAMGRTTEGGVHRLKGVPLSHTELAGDPKNPVHEDNIARLLAAAYGVQVHHIPLERVRGGFDLSGGRVFTFDAVTDEDLRLIIAGALDTGRRVLWIGTSALADNIMELERRTPPVLGVIGSLSEATGGQVRSSAAVGVKTVVLPFHQLLSGEKGPEAYVREAVESLRSGRDTMLVSSSTLSRGELDESRAEGERQGMTLAEVSDYVRYTMGEMAAEVLSQCSVSGVFVTGGDTALGLLESLGAAGSEILSEVSVGIPMMRLMGGRADGLKMVTKAGAFGSPDAIKHAFRKLKDESGEFAHPTMEDVDCC